MKAQTRQALRRAVDAMGGNRRIDVGTKASWAAQARADRLAFDIALLFLAKTPEERRWFIRENPANFAEDLRGLVAALDEIGRRYRSGLTTIAACRSAVATMIKDGQTEEAAA